MHSTSLRSNGNSDLISPTWIVDAIVAVRDRLMRCESAELVSMADVLACTLSEAVGGLTYRPEPAPARTLLDGGPAYVGPTPLEVLALQLPALSGGSPEAYQPTDSDLAEYRTWCDHLDDIYGGIDEPEPDRITDADVIAVTGCC